MKAGGLSQALESALSIYLASRIQNKAVRDVVCKVEGLASELGFLFAEDSKNCYDLEALRLLNPNDIPSETLNSYLEKNLHLQQILNDQKVFMFKTSISRLLKIMEDPNSDINSGSRVSLSLRMLGGDLDDEPRRATVIMINAEKEILSQEEMSKQLEDLDEPASVLETPNLVVIPYD